MKLIAPLLLFLLAILLTSCASQTTYTRTDGTKVYSTGEVLHKSDFSAQWQGSGSYTRTSQAKDGTVTTDTVSTNEDGIASVRSKPDGNESVRLLGWMKLFGAGVSAADNIAQDALTQ